MALRSFLLASLGLFILASPLQAAEVDNFTGRSTELAHLPDSTAALDAFMARTLKNAVDETNQTPGCDGRSFFLNIWNAVGRNPIGEAERFAERDSSVKSYLVDFKSSIYGGVATFIDEKRSPRMADLFFLSGWFGPTMRLNNQLVGIDKLGHFFGQGWEYFHLGSLESALALGIEEELGMDGFIGSGVYSYSDLSANYQGLRFWRELLDGPTPYVACDGAMFVQKREFTWRDYVSPAWDEALNCSKYVSHSMRASVESRIKKAAGACPVAPDACKTMVDLPCSSLTVSPACFALTGTSLERKSKECERLAHGTRWDPQASVKLTTWDHVSVKVDTLLGILGMSFHYLKRDYFSPKKL